MQAVIESAGRMPWQRSTLYGEAPHGQVAKSFGSAELAALSYGAAR